MAIPSKEHVDNIDNSFQENNDLNSSRTQKVNKLILDSFWKLAETNRETRLKAAETILNSLQEPKEDEISSDISYCLQRLIKGLASSRKAARQGFALLLTELLRRFPVISLDEILDLINNNLSVSGDKMEKRDHAIGQIFAFAVVIRSGKFKEKLEKVNEIIISLQNLQAIKSYLNLIVYKLLANIFNQVDSDCFKQYIWPHLQANLKTGWENCTPDILWMLFICVQLFPKILNSKFLKKYWNTSNILDEENFAHFARIIKDSSVVHPCVHPVCNIIVENLLKLDNFTEFWKVIDESLFLPGQHIKIYLGFQLIKMILPQANQKLVKSILSPNFRNVFIRSSINRHSSLNVAASEMCDFIVKYVSECKKSKIQLEILEMFLQQPGTIMFDMLTKRKTVSNIIQQLKSNAVKSFAEMLKSIFLNDKNENGEVINNQTRCFALNQISLLVRHQALISDISWKKECVQFLLLHSFFKVNQPCPDIPESLTIPANVPDTLRDVCRKSFIRSLEFLFNSSQSKKSNLQEKCEMMVSILQYTNNLLNLPENFNPLIDFDQIKEHWEKVIKMTKKLQIQQEKNEKLHESCAFQTLFVYLGLQLFIDPSETIGILQELNECCKHALMDKGHSNKIEGSKTNNEPNWIEVIIELLLSLLSQPSYLTRSIVMAVFPLFYPFITENAIQQVLDVIDPVKNSDENGPLSKTNEDDNEELSFESGTSDEEMDEDNETEINNDLRNRLQIALGNDDDDDSEHYLSDSEMFKLDNAIAQAFAKQQKPNKKITKMEETELIHFRMRCLDLLFLFLKLEPPLELVFSVILTLVNAMEYGYRHMNQDNFAKKIEVFLSSLIKYKKNADNISQSKLSELLQNLMEKAKKATDLQIQKKLNELCVYIVMCSKKIEVTQEKLSSEKLISKDWYIEDYKNLLKYFLETRSTHINQNMFILMLNACPETAWEFAEELSIAAFSSEIRLYKRTQILEILLTVLKCTKKLSTLQKKVWIKFYKKLMPNIIKAIQDIINSQEIKSEYTIDILEVVLTIEEINKKFEMSITKDYQELNELNKISSKQRQKLQTRGRRVWKKFAKLLSIKLS